MVDTSLDLAADSLVPVLSGTHSIRSRVNKQNKYIYMYVVCVTRVHG